MQYRHKRFTLYILGILFALHYALPTYVTSSFLGTFLDERLVGVVYTIASLLTVVAFFGIPRTLKSAGDYRFTLHLLLLDLLAVLVLALNAGPVLSVIAVSIHLLTVPLIYFNLDIMLEYYSTDNTTGGIRGAYLSLVNIGWVAAPILASFLLSDSNNYFLIYAGSTVALLPILFIFHAKFHDFKDPPYKEIAVAKTIRHIIVDKNTRHIFWCAFFLQFFFAWMVIYVPLYMHSHIGLGWDEIGFILAIALLPYSFIEAPLGRLADSTWGEKEILTLGFAVTGIATLALAFITTPLFILWAFTLFMTRVGGAMIEIMTETYFFKITNETDADMLSFFRMVRPFAYVIGPIVATLLFTIVTFKGLFLILGVTMFYAMRHSLAITDTK